MLTNDERTKTSSGVGQVNAAGSRTHSTAQSRDRRGKQNREIENGNVSLAAHSFCFRFKKKSRQDLSHLPISMQALLAYSVVQRDLTRTSS